jgi:hypothetical protein
MGLERGFGFVEITVPTNPVIIETISGPQSDWHDVKVIGEYAYGVSEGGAGIQVMDLSQIDSGTVTLVRNWQANGHSTTHNIVSNPERGTLFICGANIGNGGLIRCDLSDPTRPTPFAGWTEMYVHDAQVVTWEGGPSTGARSRSLLGPRRRHHPDRAPRRRHHQPQQPADALDAVLPERGLQPPGVALDRTASTSTSTTSSTSRAASSA